MKVITLTPILNWALTRKVNGKIVSDLRKQVKERLILEGGDEYEGAAIALNTVDKYWESKDRQYREYKHKSLFQSTRHQSLF